MKEVEIRKITRRELIQKGILGTGVVALLALFTGCTEEEALDNIFAKNIFAKTARFDTIYLQNEELRQAKELRQDKELSCSGIPSNPTEGKCKVINIYWNQETNRLRVVYEKA